MRTHGSVSPKQSLKSAIVNETFFDYNFRYLIYLGQIQWCTGGSSNRVDIAVFRINRSDSIFGVYNSPNSKNKVIFSDERKIDLSNLH